MAINIRRIFAALSLAAVLGLPTFAAADVTDYSEKQYSDRDYIAAMKAIDAKKWDQAVEALKKSLAHDDKSAEIYNLLGYSERNRGNLDAAFKYYDKALALDPKHRGAREYVGEAYLMVGNVVKAEEQLAALDKLCPYGCSEQTKLKSRIAEFNAKK